MNEIIVKPGVEISLGKRGENLARCAVFDISAWEKTYGEGTAHLLHQRNGDSVPYPCVIEVADGKVTWPITETDVAVAGSGRAELQYFVGETRVKSATWQTRTERGLNNAGATPEPPGENWIDTLLGLGTETQENAQAAQLSAQSAQESAHAAQQSAQAAQDSADAAAISEGNARTSESQAKTSMNHAKTQASNAAAAAEAAEAARDAAVTSENNAAVSAVNARASEGYIENLKNAAETEAQKALDAAALAQNAVARTSYIGSNGNWFQWNNTSGVFVDTGVKAQGPEGDDGVSPAVSVSPITGGTRVTIQDANGTKTFDVMNGKDGAAGSGSGDMTAAMYDPQGKRMDIFGYVDDKVADLDTPDVSGQINTHNTSGSAHSDIRALANSAGSAANSASALASDALTAANSAKSSVTTHNKASDAHSDIRTDVAKKVAKSGDTMTGDLKLQPYGNGYSVLKKNAGSGGDYGLQLQDYGDDGSFMGLTVSAKEQKLEFKKRAAGASEYTYPSIYSSDNPPGPDEVDAVPIWGGTMTGALTLSGAPYADKHAATKQYVDAVSAELEIHKSHGDAHADIREEVAERPTYEELNQVFDDYDVRLNDVMPKGGGTFTGTVKAGSSHQAPGTALLRNSKLVSTDTDPTVNGEINWTYK